MSICPGHRQLRGRFVAQQRAATALLGERAEEPRVRVRRRQIVNGRFVSIGRSSNINGRLQCHAAQTQSGLALEQTALRQRSAPVQGSDRGVLRADPLAAASVERSVGRALADAVQGN